MAHTNAKTRFPRDAARAVVAGALALVAAERSPVAFGHGDLHERIAAVERRIASEPANADHWLRRAELHRQHRDFPSAERDYARAGELSPVHPELPWMRARAWLESGDASRALTELDRYVERFPDHASARVTRARALIRLARPAAAVADYTAAIGRQPSPEPDLFLERRAAQRDAGIGPSVQLAGIEQGLQKVGSVPALEDAALELELQMSAYDAALARLDRQAVRAERQERWQYRRGLVLARAGRQTAAAEAFRSALEHVARLPPHHRSARATADLVAQLQAELARIDPREAPSLR